MFLDTAIFFALSIGIGTIGTAPTQGFTRYERSILRFAFLLTFPPLYIVQAFSSKSLRRKRLRRSLTSLVVILFFFAIFLVTPSPAEGSKIQRWDAICFARSYRSQIIRNAVPFCTLFFALVLDLSRTLPRVFRFVYRRPIPNRGTSIKMALEKPCGHQCRRPLQQVSDRLRRYIHNWTSGEAPTWMAATCGLATALFGGISLALERAGMQGLAGQNYQESEMTYGQYLAMLIWVPVLVEYAYVAVCKCTPLPYIS